MKPDSQNKKFYTIDETCHATGLGRTTVYDLMNREVLKSFKVGKRRLIDGGSIDALSHTATAVGREA